MPDLENTLFLDIETVSQRPEYYTLDSRGKKLWKQKMEFMARRDDKAWVEKDFAICYKDRAAIYAEFGKIIVISIGTINFAENGPMLHIKSFYSKNEKQLLTDFRAFLEKNFNNPKVHALCGHNIREFDIPYICRRMTTHQLPHPTLLKIAGKKPWELAHLIDTMVLWKYGDYKNYTSLDLMTYTLCIPSPKNNIDGSKVGQTFWQNNKLNEIKKYCERDVLAVAQVYQRLHKFSLLDEDQMVVVQGIG